ncbi:hypothetical protein HDU82_001159 [Entophlyctis luteolus]|nr:hypothetical protein HDU82_001159 [Entophlyctis luteolus]
MNLALSASHSTPNSRQHARDESVVGDQKLRSDSAKANKLFAFFDAQRALEMSEKRSFFDTHVRKQKEILDRTAVLLDEKRDAHLAEVENFRRVLGQQRRKFLTAIHAKTVKVHQVKVDKALENDESIEMPIASVLIADLRFVEKQLKIRKQSTSQGKVKQVSHQYSSRVTSAQVKKLKEQLNDSSIDGLRSAESSEQMRAFSRAQSAPCSKSGKISGETPQSAIAQLIRPATTEKAYRQIRLCTVNTKQKSHFRSQSTNPAIIKAFHSEAGFRKFKEKYKNLDVDTPHEKEPQSIGQVQNEIFHRLSQKKHMLVQAAKNRKNSMKYRFVEQDKRISLAPVVQARFSTVTMSDAHAFQEYVPHEYETAGPDKPFSGEKTSNLLEDTANALRYPAKWSTRSIASDTDPGSGTKFSDDKPCEESMIERTSQLCLNSRDLRFQPLRDDCLYDFTKTILPSHVLRPAKIDDVAVHFEEKVALPKIMRVWIPTQQ